MKKAGGSKGAPGSNVAKQATIGNECNLGNHIIYRRRDSNSVSVVVDQDLEGIKNLLDFPWPKPTREVTREVSAARSAVLAVKP